MINDKIVPSIKFDCSAYSQFLLAVCVGCVCVFNNSQLAAEWGNGSGDQLELGRNWPDFSGLNWP